MKSNLSSHLLWPQYMSLKNISTFINAGDTLKMYTHHALQGTFWHLYQHMIYQKENMDTNYGYYNFVCVQSRRFIIVLFDPFEKIFYSCSITFSLGTLLLSYTPLSPATAAGSAHFSISDSKRSRLMYETGCVL